MPPRYGSLVTYTSPSTIESSGKSSTIARRPRRRLDEWIGWGPCTRRPSAVSTQADASAISWMMLENEARTTAVPISSAASRRALRITSMRTRSSTLLPLPARPAGGHRRGARTLGHGGRPDRSAVPDRHAGCLASRRDRPFDRTPGTVGHVVASASTESRAMRMLPLTCLANNEWASDHGRTGATRPAAPRRCGRRESRGHRRSRTTGRARAGALTPIGIAQHPGLDLDLVTRRGHQVVRLHAVVGQLPAEHPPGEPLGVLTGRRIVGSHHLTGA